MANRIPIESLARTLVGLLFQFGSALSLFLAVCLAIVVSRAIPMAKEAKGCDPRALDLRKTSDGATPMSEIGASVMKGTVSFVTSKAFARFALLMLIPAHVSSQTAITDANIGAAVTAWIGGDATTYGNIGGWNTAAVTSMASVFASKPTFNGDISAWNTASVSNLFGVRSVPSH
jgi:hypothetical protein